MALPLESQWVLVAAGLMAHADRVLAGEECERLMMLVEQDVDGEEYAQWVSAVGEPDRLRTLLEGLQPPQAQSHRTILEEAWLMAVVDGERVEAENAMLETISDRLGVERVQLDFWREAWTQSQHDRAEACARALAFVLGDGGPPLPEDASMSESLVLGLPTLQPHRDALTSVVRAPQDHADVLRRLTALSKAGRRGVIARLAEVSEDATRRADVCGRIRALAEAAGLLEAEIEKLVGAGA